MKTKPTHKHTILWADDDLDDRHVICDIVETLRGDYQVKEVQNGCEVLTYLHSIEDPADLPCLVVLDINMPRLTGTETLSHIKKDEKYKGLTVVVFTTSSSERDRCICRRYGVPMVTKPSSYNGFKTAVMELLRLCNIREASMQG
jgi:CheY-like chemotaxis protein